MPQPITAERIRWKAVQGEDGFANDAITGAAALVPRAADLRIEIGLFFAGETIVDNFADFVSFVLQIRDQQTRRTKILEYTVAKADLETESLSLSDWNSKATDKAHIIIEVPNADMNFDLSGESENKRTFFVVGYANWTEGSDQRKTVLLKAQLTVEEYGIQTSLPALGGSNPNFRISAGGELQFKNQTTGKWATPWAIGPDGAQQIALSGGET